MPNSSNSIKSILVSKFEELNLKVDALQKYSENDFLKLSRELRNLHRKAKDIGENTKQFIDLIFGKKIYYSDDEINNEFEYIYSKSNVLNANIERIISELTNIKSRINDLIRLQNEYNSLVYNIRIILLTEENYQNSNLSNAKLDNLIRNLKWVNSLFKRNFNVLIEYFNTGIIELNKLFHNNSNVTDLIVARINEAKEISIKQKALTDSELDILSEISANYFTSIDKIVTNLQYHDIIRQKLEHIISIHLEVINELNLVVDIENHKVNDTRFLSILPDITKIHSAQIDLTNKECQAAFESIKVNLNTILDYSNTLYEICNKFYTFSSVIDDELFELTSDNEYKYLDNDNKIMQSFEIDSINRLNNINEQFAEFDKGFNDLINTLKEFNENINNNDLSNVDYFVELLSNKVNVLIENKYIIPEKIYAKINYLFEDCKKINSSVYKQIIAHSFNEDYRNLNISLNNIINGLKEKKDHINLVLTHINQLQEMLQDEINPTITHIETSSNFDKTSEDIVNDFEMIYEKIKDKIINHNIENKATNLKYIEKYYTMQSERNVHHEQSHIDGDESIVEHDDLGDVELF